MQIAVAEHISVPAEWAPQKAMWTAWPADPDQWSDDLATPRREVAALVRALSPSNRVRLLVAGDEAESTARAALGNAAELVPARYGDIWLRDTGPIFARSERGPVALQIHHQRLGRQVRSARGQHRRRRHRQACRHAGAQIRFRPRGRRYRAGRRRHAPRDAADSAQRESQWLDRGPSRSRAKGGFRRQEASSGSTEVS